MYGLWSEYVCFASEVSDTISPYSGQAGAVFRRCWRGGWRRSGEMQGPGACRGVL